MGFFRFRRRISIGPLHINLAKTGVSLTLATLISTYNIPLFGRTRPWRATIGLPGKGLAYVKQGKRGAPRGRNLSRNRTPK